MLELTIREATDLVPFVPDVGHNRELAEPFTVFLEPLTEDEDTAFKEQAAAQLGRLQGGATLARLTRDITVRNKVRKVTNLSIGGQLVTAPSDLVDKVSGRLSPKHASAILDGIWNELRGIATIEASEKKG